MGPKRPRRDAQQPENRETAESKFAWSRRRQEATFSVRSPAIADTIQQKVPKFSPSAEGST